MKITPKHREKLGEICSKLFPDHVFNFDGKDDLYLSMEAMNDKVHDINIYWFQACMIEIVTALGNADHHRKEMIKHMDQEKKIHPVDYLYEQLN